MEITWYTKCIMSQGKPYTDKQKETIIESLRESLELGFSRAKSCKMVGLDDTTLCKWVKADESLSMKLQDWENAINRIAMSNIRQQIITEVDEEDKKKEMTKWWAERKMKDDFSTRTEQTGKDGEDLFDPQAKKDMDDLLDEAFTEK